MAKQLVYTSVPQGLWPGTNGYCTVLCSDGISRDQADQLEKLSVYRIADVIDGVAVAPTLANYKRIQAINPDKLAHVVMSYRGRNVNVLFKTCLDEFDYSNRMRKLSHFLLLDEREKADVGPGWMINQPQLFLGKWSGAAPRLLPESEDKELPRGAVSPAICRTWQRVAGDAGWAGDLIRCTFADRDRPMYVVVNDEIDAKQLVAEAIALVPQKRRWEVTFSTRYVTLPHGITCQWRFIRRDTPEYAAAQSAQNKWLLDLTTPPGAAPAGDECDAARAGQVVVITPPRPVGLAPPSLAPQGPAPQGPAPQAPVSLGTPQSAAPFGQAMYNFAPPPAAPSVSPPLFVSDDDDLMSSDFRLPPSRVERTAGVTPPPIIGASAHGHSSQVPPAIPIEPSNSPISSLFSDGLARAFDKSDEDSFINRLASGRVPAMWIYAGAAMVVFVCAAVVGAVYLGKSLKLEPPIAIAHKWQTTADRRLPDAEQSKSPEKPSLLSGCVSKAGLELFVHEIKYFDESGKERIEKVEKSKPARLMNGYVLVVNPDGSYDFDPTARAKFLHSRPPENFKFEYRVRDRKEQESDFQPVTITVKGVNHPPKIVKDKAVLKLDTTRTPEPFKVGNFVEDRDGDELTYKFTFTNETPKEHRNDEGLLGEYVEGENGLLNFKLNHDAIKRLPAGVTGKDVVVYTVTDNYSPPVKGKFEVTVVGKDDPLEWKGGRKFRYDWSNADTKWNLTDDVHDPDFPVNRDFVIKTLKPLPLEGGTSTPIETRGDAAVQDDRKSITFKALETSKEVTARFEYQVARKSDPDGLSAARTVEIIIPPSPTVAASPSTTTPAPSPSGPVTAPAAATQIMDITAGQNRSYSIGSESQPYYVFDFSEASVGVKPTPNVQMTLEPLVSIPGKGHLTLTGGNDGLWSLVVSGGERSDGTPAGDFFLENETLRFKWRASVDQREVRRAIPLYALKVEHKKLDRTYQFFEPIELKVEDLSLHAFAAKPAERGSRHYSVLQPLALSDPRLPIVEELMKSSLTFNMTPKEISGRLGESEVVQNRLVPFLKLRSPPYQISQKQWHLIFESVTHKPGDNGSRGFEISYVESLTEDLKKIATEMKYRMEFYITVTNQARDATSGKPDSGPSKVTDGTASGTTTETTSKVGQPVYVIMLAVPKKQAGVPSATTGTVKEM